MAELDDESKLIRRIEALEKLLVCFRVGKGPSEALFAELDRTKGWYVAITDRRSRGAAEQAMESGEPMVTLDDRAPRAGKEQH